MQVNSLCQCISEHKPIWVFRKIPIKDQAVSCNVVCGNLVSDVKLQIFAAVYFFNCCVHSLVPVEECSNSGFVKQTQYYFKGVFLPLWISPFVLEKLAFLYYANQEWEVISGTCNLNNKPMNLEHLWKYYSVVLQTLHQKCTSQAKQNDTQCGGGKCWREFYRFLPFHPYST